MSISFVSVVKENANSPRYFILEHGNGVLLLKGCFNILAVLCTHRHGLVVVVRSEGMRSDSFWREARYEACERVTGQAHGDFGAGPSHRHSQLASAWAVHSHRA